MMIIFNKYWYWSIGFIVYIPCQLDSPLKTIYRRVSHSQVCVISVSVISIGAAR